MDTISQMISAPSVNWGLYFEYKAKYIDSIRGYLYRTRIPDYIRSDLEHDAVMDMLTEGREVMDAIRCVASPESNHWSDRVYHETPEVMEQYIDDPIFHSKMPKVHTMLDGIPEDFLCKYCTDREREDIRKLQKYGSPYEYAKHCGYSNVLLAQRICGVLRKFKRHKRGEKIKGYDRHELDDTKITTTLRKEVASRYRAGMAYKEIAEQLGRSVYLIANMVHSMRKR